MLFSESWWLKRAVYHPISVDFESGPYISRFVIIPPRPPHHGSIDSAPCINQSSTRYAIQFDFRS